MQNKIDPQAQSLLDELTEKSYLDRQKEIVKLLEPFSDAVIPVLIERLKDQSKNYDIRYNAIEILALSSDPRAILPVIRHIETVGGWVGRVFDYFRQGLKEKDNDMRQKLHEQLIKYLEEGPRIPVPTSEPFDSAARENSFNDFVGALMKMAGITELDDEAQKLAGEAKEKWVQPHDAPEPKKDEIPEHHLMIVEVIDTLSEFGGLQDPRLEALLSKYIRNYGFDSIAGQHALSALARINPMVASSHLIEMLTSQEDSFNMSNVRVVSTKMDYERESTYFNICIPIENEPKWKDQPYLFLFEKGLVFFLARGEEAYQWFAGQAENKNAAIQTAIAYLGRWLPNISTMNNKKAWSSRDKYFLIHHAETCSKLLEALEKHLDFDRWGFHQSYISPNYSPTVIYDSEYCRIKFFLRGADNYGNLELSVYYGRLHASSNSYFMILNGTNCWCWHPDYYFLPFLDGITPQEAARTYTPSPALEQFHKSERAKDDTSWQGIRKQAVIWGYYGHRLFDLFDIRQPELWEQYDKFMKEMHTNKDRTSFHGHPPRDQIC